MSVLPLETGWLAPFPADALDVRPALVVFPEGLGDAELAPALGELEALAEVPLAADADGGVSEDVAPAVGAPGSAGGLSDEAADEEFAGT